MLVPLNVAPWLWGWPDKFMQRMDAAGVDVFVIGPYDGSFGTSGIDDLEQFARSAEGLRRRHLDQSHRPHRRCRTRQRHGAVTAR